MGRCVSSIGAPPSSGATSRPPAAATQCSLMSAGWRCRVSGVLRDCELWSTSIAGRRGRSVHEPGGRVDSAVASGRSAHASPLIWSGREDSGQHFTSNRPDRDAPPSTRPGGRQLTPSLRNCRRLCQAAPGLHHAGGPADCNGWGRASPLLRWSARPPPRPDEMAAASWSASTWPSVWILAPAVESRSTPPDARPGTARVGRGAPARTGLGRSSKGC